MEKVSTLGVDLAKNDFQVCAMNHMGKVLFNRKMSRRKILDFICNLNIAADFHIAMEACGGANHWGRTLQSKGFSVKLIAPQFVKPYVKSNKNDHNDAEAIAEASRRPTMRFVGVKSEFQQEIKAIHSVRANLVKRKTSISNEIRAILFEFGIVIPKGLSQTRKNVPLILEDGNMTLSCSLRELVHQLYEELLEVTEKVIKLENKLKTILNSNESKSSKLHVAGYLKLFKKKLSKKF